MYALGQIQKIIKIYWDCIFPKSLAFKMLRRPSQILYALSLHASQIQLEFNSLTELTFLARLSPSLKFYYNLLHYNLEFQNVR